MFGSCRPDVVHDFVDKDQHRSANGLDGLPKFVLVGGVVPILVPAGVVGVEETPEEPFTKSRCWTVKGLVATAGRHVVAAKYDCVGLVEVGCDLPFPGNLGGHCHDLTPDVGLDECGCVGGQVVHADQAV